MEAHRASLGYLEAPVDPAKRVLIGLLMALTGGSLSAVSLVSGTIQVSRGAEQISRTNAPDEFWSLVLGCAALAVIGTCLTVVTLYRMDNEEITEMLEALGISRRRLYQYLSLFVFWRSSTRFISRASSRNLPKVISAGGRLPSFA
jgi:hypothetical protein